VWCGKVSAQMVERTLIVWKDLGSSPMNIIYVLFKYYYFNDMINHVSHDIMLK